MFFKSFCNVLYGWFLEDKHKVLNHKPYEVLTKQDVYFIRVKVTKLNKHLDFLLTYKMNEVGVIDFIHDMENESIYIGKVGLGEMIEHHIS